MASYTIQKGDTLSKIASANNTTVNQLLALNPNITNPNLIYSGSAINVSPATPTTSTTTTPTTATTTPAVSADTGDIYSQQLAKLKENQTQQKTWMDETKTIQEQQIQANQELAIAEINKQKGEADKTLQKTKTGAYTDFMKSVNPYGVNRETQVSQGLGNTGLAESTQAAYFNAYQTTVSNAIESTNKIKADYDLQINKAILEGNSELAELAVANYEQQITNMWNAYEMEVSILNNQQDFNYPKEQDAISNKKSRSRSGGSGGDGVPIIDTPVETQTYFSNGYQPDNIGGVKLSVAKNSKGETTKKVIMPNGNKQNVWTTGDKKYYLWDGQLKQYIQVKWNSKTKQWDEV